MEITDRDRSFFYETSDRFACLGKVDGVGWQRPRYRGDIRQERVYALLLRVTLMVAVSEFFSGVSFGVSLDCVSEPFCADRCGEVKKKDSLKTVV